MSITGQCLCGAIKYEIANAPAMTGVFHCNRGIPPARRYSMRGDAPAREVEARLLGQFERRDFVGNEGAMIPDLEDL